MECFKVIKKKVAETGLKQYVIAEKCGFSAKDFSMIVNGRKPVYIDDVPAICIGLGITPDELFEWDKKTTSEEVVMQA